MITVRTIEPAACSKEEVVAFSKLVLEGGEVAAATLTQGIRRARALAFLMDGPTMAGVAGLKRPVGTYREKVSLSSGVDLSEIQVPYELGWIYVQPQYRGGKAMALCEALLPYAGDYGVFATSRTNNPRMHASLAALGFDRRGKQWPSGENEAELALFIR